MRTVSAIWLFVFRVSSICALATMCKDGVDTVLRTPTGVAILKTFPTDIQCTKCAPCQPGTIQISRCTNTTQTVCAICPRNGASSMFLWNGMCMYGGDSYGGSNYLTLSQTPTGYFPYILRYLSSLTSTISNNSIAFPTRLVETFTQNPDNYSVTTSLIPFGSSIILNIFIPCATPPLGWRFKAWSVYQKNAVSVTCTSLTNCANFRAPCDLSTSTECIGWNSTLKQGWYSSAPGKCTLCPNSSRYSTCNWGFYRNLTSCRPDRVPQCVPCRGSLPPNAVWTTSKHPHYFDDVEPTPCDWDCDRGFYRDGATCQACMKPENSEFEYGPYIGYGNTNPPPKTCLDPVSCKYFGGVKEFGCAWKCPMGYLLITPQPGFGDPMCIPCPVISCEADEIIVLEDSCNTCLKCANVVANAVYHQGCTFTCAQGYYLLNSTCAPCPVKTCPVGQYSGGCNGTSGGICLLCTTCAVGYSISTPCSATADAVCAPCAEELVLYSTYDSSCNVVCMAGFVWVPGAIPQCVPCALSNSSCRVGGYMAATCTAQNLGCEACVTPKTDNWCWTGEEDAACSWDCGQLYRKDGNVCVPDAMKTTDPCIGFIFEEVTTLGETTIGYDVTTHGKTSTTRTTPGTSVNDTNSTTPGTSVNDTNNTTSSTPVNNTTPDVTNVTQQPIMRNTLSIANMSMHECACASALIAEKLSLVYRTQVFSVACEMAGASILCVNFTCPCAVNQRLLQANTTQYKYVRRETPVTVSVETLTDVVRYVVPDALVLSSVAVRMATTVIVWDNSLSTWIPDAVVDIIATVLIGLLVVLVIMLIIWMCEILRKSRQVLPKASSLALPKLSPNVPYQKLKQ